MRHLTGALTQNEEVKRISAWAAIMFAPTLVGTIYGMNFDYMPELGWRYGYPWRCWHGGDRCRPLPGVQTTPLVVGRPNSSSASLRRKPMVL
jgi:hypothetical protein